MKKTTEPNRTISPDEAALQVAAIRANDIFAGRKKSGAMSKAELEWLEKESRTYQRPSSGMRRFVDPTQPAINLEYRRRSIKLDQKKVRKLTAQLQAEGLTQDEIAVRVAEAGERGELMNNESVSFARQHDENVNLARQEGIDLSTAIAFEEEGSAYKRKRRPEFDAMMKWIESFEGTNPVNLYVYELSRLFRNKDVADEAIALLTRKKVNLRIASQPQIHLDDEMSAMFLPLLVQFAINESKQTSKRTTSGQKTRANLGTVRTSIPPVGLTTTKAMTAMGERSVYTPNRAPRNDYPGKKSEAWLIQEIYSRYETGDSVTAICQWLNDSKFPTSKASSWNENTVMRMLRNPHYAGYIRHNQIQEDGKRLPLTAVRDQIVKNEDGTYFEAFEPVVSRDRWWQVQAIIDHRYRPRGPQRTTHRLAGILVCARCEGKMFGQSNEGKSRAYRCPHSFRNSRDKVATSNDVVCVANNILSEGLDEVVYRLATRIIGNTKMLEEISQRPMPVVEVDDEARQALLAKISKLEALYNDETDQDVRLGYKAALNSATDRLTKMNAQQQVAVQVGHKALGSVAEFNAMWNSNDKTAIIMALRVLIEKIEVSPITNKRMNRRALDNKGWLCDYSRVTIVWANGSRTQLEEAFNAGNEALNAA